MMQMNLLQKPRADHQLKTMGQQVQVTLSWIILSVI